MKYFWNMVTGDLEITENSLTKRLLLEDGYVEIPKEQFDEIVSVQAGPVQTESKNTLTVFERKVVIIALEMLRDVLDGHTVPDKRHRKKFWELRSEIGPDVPLSEQVDIDGLIEKIKGDGL